jgi:hypothetical protein
MQIDYTNRFYNWNKIGYAWTNFLKGAIECKIASEPIWFKNQPETNINLSTKDVNINVENNISIMVCTPVHSEVSMHYTQALLEFQKDLYVKRYNSQLYNIKIFISYTR